jgi:hypothetical protein
MIILMALKLHPATSHMDVAHQTASCLRAAVGLVVSVGIAQAVGNYQKNYKYVTCCIYVFPCLIWQPLGFMFLFGLHVIILNEAGHE